MPVGVPKRGYRVTKKLEGKTLADIERELAFRVPDLVAKLEEMTKPLRCPNCGVEVKQVDRDAIIYLIDRAMGKPRQKLDVDVLPGFTADDLDRFIEEFVIPRVREVLGEEAVGVLTGTAMIRQNTVIEGEVKLLEANVSQI